MSKQKFYVVWKGRKPGIYTSWDDCSKQVLGFDRAQFKSYKTKSEAVLAYKQGPAARETAGATFENLKKIPDIVKNSVCVDAACSGNPGVLEYRGVETFTGTELFRKKPIPMGTNNLGEFLALVHALSLYIADKRLPTLYSDSEIAIKWVRQQHAQSKLQRNAETKEVWALVDRAEKWLKETPYTNKILKWNTKKWGENPADFNRK